MDNTRQDGFSVSFEGEQTWPPKMWNPSRCGSVGGNNDVTDVSQQDVEVVEQ